MAERSGLRNAWNTAHDRFWQPERDCAVVRKQDRKNPIPSDGLVLIYDDIEYGRSWDRRLNSLKDSIAFKWKDEIRETTLEEIEWSASRTGLINPIAVFDPVQLRELP